MSNVSLVETSCVITSKQSHYGCYILGAFHPSVRQGVDPEMYFIHDAGCCTWVAFYISVTQMLTQADRLHIMHL